MEACVAPRIIPGPVINENRDDSHSLVTGVLSHSRRADWSNQNLLAYACQQYVTVADPLSVQHVTVLQGHSQSSIVTAVRWIDSVEYRSLSKIMNVQPKLASGDDQGNIIVWDVMSRNPISFLTDSGKSPIIDIVVMSDTRILVLSANNVLALWDYSRNIRIWHYEFKHPVFGVRINPFRRSHACLPARDGTVIFIEDLSLSSPPKIVREAFRVGVVSSGKIVQTKSQHTRLRDVVFNPDRRGQLFLVLHKEVRVYDMEVSQMLRQSTFSSPRNEFLSLHMCRINTDMAYTYHIDGRISVWILDKKENRYRPSFCDVVRGGKHGLAKIGKVFAWAPSPVNEHKLCAISADGTLWAWNIHRIKSNQPEKSIQPQFALSGFLEGISGPISSISTSPYEPILAVGLRSGRIQTVDLNTGRVLSKFEPFTHSPVLGTRWCGKAWIAFYGSVKSKHSQDSNAVVILNISSGSHITLKRDRPEHSDQIRGIRVSASRRYLLVLVKDRPAELWNLETLQQISIVKLDHVLAVEWRPSIRKRRHRQPSSFSDSKLPTGSSQPSEFEEFVCINTDGIMHWFVVERDRVRPIDSKTRTFSYNSVSSLAWKGNMLVSGDTSGTISCFNSVKPYDVKTVNTHRGVVKRLFFSPDEGTPLLLAVFGDGDYGVWNAEQGKRLALSSHLKSDVRAIDVAWAPGNLPIVATESGNILILNRQLSTANVPVSHASLAAPLRTPALMPLMDAMHFRSLLEHGNLDSFMPLSSASSLSSSSSSSSRKETEQTNKSKEIKEEEEEEKDSNLSNTSLNSAHSRNELGEATPPKSHQSVADRIRTHTQLLPRRFLRRVLHHETNTINRCLETAKFFGDTSAVTFWTLAQYFMTKHPPSEQILKEDFGVHSPSEEEEKEYSSGHTIESLLNSSEKEARAKLSPLIVVPSSAAGPDENLPPFFDMLRDNESVQAGEFDLIEEQERTVKRQTSSNLLRQLAQRQSVLGKKEHAVSTLLETPTDHKDFVFNSMQACIIAASLNDQVYFQHTVKFVANNLIACNRLQDGVELLCLVGKGYEACRYLQMHDHWEQSVRIAKSTLAEKECNEILARWANHLSSSGEMMKSAGVWLSMGRYDRALRILHISGNDDIAALFIKACEEMDLMHAITTRDSDDVLNRVEDSNNQNEQIPQNPVSVRQKAEGEMSSVMAGIYERYANLLQNVGNDDMAKSYLEKRKSIAVQPITSNLEE